MKIFKKSLSLILVATMVFALVACGGSGSKKTDNVAQAAAESTTKKDSGFQKITLASGGASGTYYGFSGVVAQRLNEVLKDKLNISVVTTGASKANAIMIDDNDAQIAIIQNDVMSYAYKATDMFAGNTPVTFNTLYLYNNLISDS